MSGRRNRLPQHPPGQPARHARRRLAAYRFRGGHRAVHRKGFRADAKARVSDVQIPLPKRFEAADDGFFPRRRHAGADGDRAFSRGARPGVSVRRPFRRAGGDGDGGRRADGVRLRLRTRQARRQPRRARLASVRLRPGRKPRRTMALAWGGRRFRIPRRDAPHHRERGRIRRSHLQPRLVRHLGFGRAPARPERHSRARRRRRDGSHSGLQPVLLLRRANRRA